MMKKLFIQCLLLGLPAFLWPAHFSANNIAEPPIVTTGAYDCPLPPPAWVAVSNVTPSSITLTWAPSPSPVIATYKIDGWDVTNGSDIPTYYTSGALTFTVPNLSAGHLYQFDISASTCGQQGPFGQAISIQQQTGYIIIDIVAEHTLPCAPNTSKPTGVDISYDFCIRQSTNPKSPFTNAFRGQFQYQGQLHKFGMAALNITANVHGLDPLVQGFKFEHPFNLQTGEPDRTFANYLTPDGEVLLTIENRNYAPTSGGLLMRITFNGDYGPFSYCNANGNCSNGSGEPPGGEGRSDSDIEIADIPENTVLIPPSPNPFSEKVAFTYSVAEGSPVQIALYDPMGRLVRYVENVPSKPAGLYDVTVDGSGLPDGVYFLHIMTGENRKVFSLVKHD